MTKSEFAAITGSAMDRVVPVRRRTWIAAAVTVSVLVLGGSFLVFLVAGRTGGQAAAISELQIATVTAGYFLDELVLRSRAEPLLSILLDAAEGGRVESVLVGDGATVKQGQILFKLVNPSLQQQLLAREAEVAQQISNLGVQRSNLEASRTEHRRRIAELSYELQRAQDAFQRNSELFSKGFISDIVMRDSAEKLNLQRQLMNDARYSSVAELSIKEESVKHLDQLIKGLVSGLAIVRKSVDELNVRAPISGRLTDFQLTPGALVKPGDKLGRVDDPSKYRLTADVDEYYIDRTSSGLVGVASVSGRDYAVELTRVYPQIKEGRFRVDLEFRQAAPPELRAGQAIDVRLTLGSPSSALILPDGAFYADTAGRWVFVLSPSGDRATRRSVKLGRKASGQIEVLDGLSPGEKVIISGYNQFERADQLTIR